MKNIYLAILVLLLIQGVLMAQGLYNNGGKITLKSNAYITIIGANANFVNTTSGLYQGTIDNDGTISVEGNWTNNANNLVFINQNNNGIVLLNGTNSSIYGSSETKFENFAVTSANGITLQKSTEIDGTLTLNNGKFRLNGFTLTIPANGNIIGGNSNGYIVSGNSTSTLKRYINTSNVVYAFPLGDSVNYTPITFAVTTAGALSGSSTIEASVTPSSHPQKGNVSSYLNRYWTLTPTNIAANALYNIEYSYGPDDLVGSPSSIFPYKYDALGWVSVPGSEAEVLQGTGSLNAQSRTFTWSGLNTFSDYTGNGGATPMPITLLNFDVSAKDGNVLAKWRTASQINNDYFVVQHSTDAKTFFSVGQVKGAGNSNQVLEYYLWDTMPYQGTSYYRLKQIDMDGKATYSDIKAVEINKKEKLAKLFSIYPNPSNIGGVYVQYKGLHNVQLQITVHNMLGENVINKVIAVDSGSESNFVSLNNLPIGVYYLKISNGYEYDTCKLLLEDKK